MALWGGGGASTLIQGFCGPVDTGRVDSPDCPVSDDGFSSKPNTPSYLHSQKPR